MMGVFHEGKPPGNFLAFIKVFPLKQLPLMNSVFNFCLSTLPWGDPEETSPLLSIHVLTISVFILSSNHWNEYDVDSPQVFLHVNDVKGAAQFETYVSQTPGMDKALAGVKGHALFIFRGYFRNDMADALFHGILFQTA